MGPLAIGISLHSPHPPRRSPELVPAYVDAFTSATWPRPLRYFIGIADAPRDAPRRPGMLKPKTIRDELAALLVSDGLSNVTLQSSAKNDDQFASFTAQTRLRPHHELARTHGYHYLNAETALSAAGWIDAMLAFATATGVTHGVLFVMNEDGAASEASFVARTRDGVDQHPFPDEFDRMRRVERELGTSFVRFPRWGTILAKRHIDALGGLRRIVEAVKPALVRDLGEAVYVQLTNSVATATSPDSLAQQRAFTALAAPLLPGSGARP